jgi:hypothetical protein
MQEAIRNAFMHNFQTLMGSRVDTVNPLLVLHIHRGSIVQDTINQVKLLKEISSKENFFFLSVG